MIYSHNLLPHDKPELTAPPWEPFFPSPFPKRSFFFSSLMPFMSKIFFDHWRSFSPHFNLHNVLNTFMTVFKNAFFSSRTRTRSLLFTISCTISYFLFMQQTKVFITIWGKLLESLPCSLFWFQLLVTVHRSCHPDFSSLEICLSFKSSFFTSFTIRLKDHLHHFLWIHPQFYQRPFLN